MTGWLSKIMEWIMIEETLNPCNRCWSQPTLLTQGKKPGWKAIGCGRCASVVPMHEWNMRNPLAQRPDNAKTPTPIKYPPPPATFHNLEVHRNDVIPEGVIVIKTSKSIAIIRDGEVKVLTQPGAVII